MQHKANQGIKFRPRRLGHVNLTVSDLERSMAFYTRVLGIEEVRREPDIKAGFLSNGNTHHDVALVEVGVLAKQAGFQSVWKRLTVPPGLWSEYGESQTPRGPGWRLCRGYCM